MSLCHSLQMYCYGCYESYLTSKLCLGQLSAHSFFPRWRELRKMGWIQPWTWTSKSHRCWNLWAWPAISDISIYETPSTWKSVGQLMSLRFGQAMGGFDGLTIFIKERWNVCIQGSPTSLCFSAWNVLLVDRRHWGTAQPGSCPH